MRNRRSQKIERPQRVNLHDLTGGGCREFSRTCGETLCRFHLDGPIEDGENSDALERRKAIANRPELCALDAADIGGMSLQEVADRLGATRERVRQIELAAVQKLRAAGFAVGDR